ncbi:MAG: porin [Betaproteobacteria bacterium]|nr:porin [Betaproteobacteria bacterium]NJD64327.1 porin [Chloroflexota bacterium]
MKVRTLALAVATLAAPYAAAQTANPVTLYGRVYLNLESVEAKGGTASLPQRTRVQDRSSLFGIRGTEDLGGGLKAFFQLESTFLADQLGSAFANRNSGVGLQGNFGSVLIGRWDTPMKFVSVQVDPFGDIGLGDITAAALGRIGTNGSGGNFNQRMNNTVQWWSPNWAGFSGRLMYVANEPKSATANPTAYGGSVSYAKGNVLLSYAYEEHRDAAGTPTGTASPGLRETGNVLAGRVAFGPARLMAQYGVYERDGPATVATKKNVGYMVAADATFGKNVVIVSYQRSQDGGLATAAAQPDCKVYSIGYRYDFSRRTSFVAEVAKVDNNNFSACNFGHGPLAGLTNGQDPQGMGIGLRHVF